MARVLLSGGNPQIAKGVGDGPVQDWIAALPGWKGPVAAEVDALIVREVPGVVKAVKWNSPLYGMPGQGWFLGLHALTRYVKLAFFRGSHLSLLPPVASKSPDTRYVHITEGAGLDVAQLALWVAEASRLPGVAL